ncbi:MAG: colicin immunity domain-containing protein [Hyphomonadaceae bacterium]
MSPAEWRALIEAYLDGRLSADAFERRFLDAWRDERDRHLPTHPAIETLFYVVEAFTQDQTNRNEYDADETELRQAARIALAELREAAPTRTYDRARAREEMGRFQVRVQQIAGIGCAIALAWFALCILQIYFVSEQIQHALHWGAWPSAFAGFFLAFVPIVGNLLAYFGATGAGWPPLIAGIVFFAAPAAAFISGLWRWRRWRARQ